MEGGAMSFGVEMAEGINYIITFDIVVSLHITIFKPYLL
jgi:hypothetical protein